MVMHGPWEGSIKKRWLRLLGGFCPYPWCYLRREESNLDLFVYTRNEKGQLGLGDNTPHVGGPVKVPAIYTNAGKKSTNVKFVTGAVCDHLFSDELLF